MRAFARLYTELDSTTSTRAKLDALVRYFSQASSRDAAWAVYFLAGGKPRQVVPTKVLRELAIEAAQIPEWLFEESYQAVGDLAETIALLLPLPGIVRSSSELGFADWIDERLLGLRKIDDAVLRERLRAYWRELDASGRFVWNKLITGSFRVGVSKLLVVRALGEVAGIDAKLISERLAGSWEPNALAYAALISKEASVAAAGQPYPFFLSHQLQVDPSTLGDVHNWQAEWKWDGIRAQLIRRAKQTFLWSRGDELITDRFPEIAAAGERLPEGTVIDGEVLAWREGVLPFAKLQQRIGRKTLSPKVLTDAPAAFLAYDLLEIEGQDQRMRSLEERRASLEALVAQVLMPALGLSALVVAESWEELARLRGESRSRLVEGLMLKHKRSLYGVGRVKGEQGSGGRAASDGGTWWKWKIDPYSVDAVLIYAQRGHGRRASLYTDYTFAVWNADELVPFTKAYSGLTDAEIREVDDFIRKNTLEKFGPVRSVTPKLVFEIGFEGIQYSSRHKSGVAVRFPRMLRIRHDKKIEDADTLGTLRALIALPAP